MPKTPHTFKTAALSVLKESKTPLHVSEITKRILEAGMVQSQGLTPEATVNARIITDINALGEMSGFIKTAPATYMANEAISQKQSEKLDEETQQARQLAINSSVSSKQKGDIAEARIAELITLYGDSGLSCYKPISDDEGIDIIVKQRGSLKTLYVQVKSRWSDGSNITIADVKRTSLIDNYAMGVVVCKFNTEKGDIDDYLWYIPAPDFINLSEKNNENIYRFRTLKKEDRWDKYMIDRRDLANKLLDLMNRL